MGKLYLVGDIHFGARKSSPVFLKYLTDCLDDMIKKLTKLDRVVILGDIFEHRNSVDFTVLNTAISYFEKLSNSCNYVDILVGNHDLYYKQCEYENINCRFLEMFKNVRLFHGVETSSWDAYDILYCGWIDNPEKKHKLIKSIKKQDIILGHFDCNEVYGGENLKPTYIGSSEIEGPLIFSGHYHQRRKIGNINYVGSFISTTFSDINNKKGYYVLETKNDKLDVKFVKNNCPNFTYFEIENQTNFIETMENIAPEDEKILKNSINGNYIKIFLNEYDKNNVAIYNIIKKYEPKDITVSYNRQVKENTETKFEGFDIKDIEFHKILIKYIKEKVDENIINPDNIVNKITHYHQKFNEENA